MEDSLFADEDGRSEENLAKQAAWVMKLRSVGVQDLEVLGALEAIPRKIFLSASQQFLAYEDRAFPIDCGQMSTQPSLIGKVADFLQMKPDHSLLEIGTGSGYQCAVLSKICDRIVSLERYRTLADLSRERLRSCKITNVDVVHADGFAAPIDEEDDGGPFDRIILNGALERVPGFLFDRLAPGGRLLAPLKKENGMCHLIQYDKGGRGLDETMLGRFRYVSLTPGIAAKL
ncbi:Protein-L-isoaspartate O-methyltransferase [Pseudovibrio axinellae]|uniref:Protein-L-isoaspartate O-methyltransferase n=1 Tax=Pseudovibrio axinellae TaxID=989403 RepID=A0A165YQL2_9HYPH|nr:rRNA adenine N-6-methyltransferase family protein [Pseudovibrio axinellae]KZL19129.1 Protein-L-isoaspartate O-methyltransferase [Pseudovibrio axinellae]SER34221.1 protein-L-isoaspartate(D-aspartate) O-methyltransferase [Pseudovibrio axinellae]